MLANQTSVRAPSGIRTEGIASSVVMFLDITADDDLRYGFLMKPVDPGSL